MSRLRVNRVDTRQLRITPVALALLILLVGVSMVYGLSSEAGQLRMIEWAVPSGATVWREGRVWTLLSGPFLQPRMFSLLIEGAMLWLLMPQLERWWGGPRFALFVGLTALAGTTFGTLAGFLLDEPAAIVGLNPSILSGAVAFGIIFARQPVQFFGVLPLTGRQFMWGMLALTALFVLVGQEWTWGAAMAAAIGVGALLATGRFDPIALWRRRSYEKARAHLRVVPAEPPAGKRRPGTEDRYLN